MEKLLEFNDNPPIKTYNHHAFGTGIITSVKDGINWIYNNYIQISYYPEESFTTFDYHMDYIYCQPVFSHEYIGDDVIKSLGINVMDYILEAVMNGKYVIMCVNEYYIPNREAYMSYSYNHNIMLYGYDEKTRMFNTAGYDEEGHFSFQQIDKKLIKKAGPNKIILLKLREDYDFTLNPEWIRYQLDAYYGRGKQFPVGCYPKEDKLLGLLAIDRLYEDISDKLETLEQIDVRPLVLLAEHGRIMCDRIEAVKYSGVISDAEEVYWNKESERRELILKRTYMYNIRLDENSANKLKELMTDKISIEF